MTTMYPRHEIAAASLAVFDKVMFRIGEFAARGVLFIELHPGDDDLRAVYRYVNQDRSAATVVSFQVLLEAYGDPDRMRALVERLSAHLTGRGKTLIEVFAEEAERGTVT